MQSRIFAEDSQFDQFEALTPCGICQEWLRYCENDIMVVGAAADVGSLKFVMLGELMPYYRGRIL